MEIYTRVLEYVRANPGVSASELSSAVPGRNGAKLAAIRALLDSGQLRDEGLTTRRRLFVAGSAPAAQASQPQLGDLQRGIIAAAKRGTSLEELCDQLDLSPRRVLAAVAELRASGVQIELAGGTVGIRPPEVGEAIAVDVAQVDSLYRVGVISDLHLGSRYCLRDYLRDAVSRMYSSGIRLILCPGDMIDGCYDHGKWELTHHGLEDQVTDLADTLPRKDGLRYVAITGNHDETFWNKIGVNVGRTIEAARPDIAVVGDRGARLRVGGALVDLWHPSGSGSYAKSYHLQKKIEGYQPGDKPDILLTGHYHQYAHIADRGINGLLCPTFQSGQSRFGRSLKGTVAIGALTLEWGVTQLGTVRDVNVTLHSYYVREEPRDVHLPPVGSPAQLHRCCT